MTKAVIQNDDCCGAGTGYTGPAEELSTSEADLDALFEKVCNWGRWGDDDERGTLNHIGPDEVAHAATLVTVGRTVSMSRGFPTVPSIENPRPAQHYMVVTGEDRQAPHIAGMECTSDYIGLAFHGLACSHIDALCHTFHRGRMYNGRPASDVKSRGAVANTIMAIKDGIVGRGVLLDMPRALGVDFIEPSHLVTSGELEIAERELGVTLRKGDILAVRMGRDVRPGRGDGRMAGLHPFVAGWLHDRNVAVICGDGPNDANPAGVLSAWPYPVHDLCVAGMGIPLVDNLYLEGVAATCAELNRWAFQIVIAPLLIEGGTGSPVNPIAIF
ncbi:cyclase family protein [Sphingobium sp. SCG-1]|uniref:cyclase family protein n=1 Tax=Sphingobium sp. SCG-1 TaxID=2072936 RepID=UPI0016704835|nr:cyclase family protein [Sphingobium sp. SCG-1]